MKKQQPMLPLAVPAPALIRASGSADLANSNGRIIRYMFSDTSVGRDNHVIEADAWDVDNFLKNAVFLWAHQGEAPPIGRVVELDSQGSRLVGSVEYAERDLYPFADTIFQLVRGGYLNATSTSWRPLEWKFSSDRARPGGVDFKRVELLEISQVPVPALPTALATARAAGIDTGPLYDWAEKVLDDGGMIIIPRKELEALRRDAKMPKAKPAKAAAAVDPATEQQELSPRVAAPKISKRGLYECTWLASMLSDLGYLEDMVEWEADAEGDGSGVPAQLTEAMKALGAVLVAMTAEEVAEMFAEEGGTARVLSDDPTVMASATPAQKAFVRLTKMARLATLLSGRRYVAKSSKPLTDIAAKRIRDAVEGWRETAGSTLVLDPGVDLTVIDDPRHVSFPVTDVRAAGNVTVERAGKVLSSANDKTLRDGHDLITRGCDMVRSVFEAASGDNAGDEEQRAAIAARSRRARALKRRANLMLVAGADAA